VFLDKKLKKEDIYVKILITVIKMAKKINIIPFRETGDVSARFTMIDFGKALESESGRFVGLVSMIHMNLNHPDLSNIMMDVHLQDMLIYTTEGWKKCEFDEIYIQLMKECKDCLAYIQDNEALMKEQIRLYEEGLMGREK